MLYSRLMTFSHNMAFPRNCEFAFVSYSTCFDLSPNWQALLSIRDSRIEIVTCYIDRLSIFMVNNGFIFLLRSIYILCSMYISFHNYIHNYYHYILHIHYIFLIIYLYIFIIINLFQLNYSKIEFVFDYCLIITWSIFLWNEFIWSFFYRLVDYFNFENEKNFNIDSIFYIFKEKFDVLFLYRIYLFYSIIFIWYILSFQQYLYFYNEHLS